MSVSFMFAIFLALAQRDDVFILDPVYKALTVSPVPNPFKEIRDLGRDLEVWNQDQQ